jgi:septum formation protein maf
MLDNLQKYEIILASNSPRRRELLTNLGITFSPFVIFGIDESYPSDLKGEEVALFVAEKKAAAYKEHIRDNRLIVTADTIVSTAEGVLGKPQDEQAARDMLRLISGREHTVTTAFTLNTTECHVSRAVTTVVKFAPLTDEMIEYYIRRFLPFDKAGAYGIQEWIGLAAVESINGSYSNVVGLPTQQLYEALSKLCPNRIILR